MNIRRKRIERVTITGPDAEWPKAFAYCEKHGLRVTRSGPVQRVAWAIVPGRFKVVAERAVSP